MDSSQPPLLYSKMGLNRKSKRLLDILLLSGLDLLEVSASPKSILYDSVGWNSQRNATRHLGGLSEKGLIELRKIETKSRWVAKLTGAGKEAALGYSDRAGSWDRDWDGKWRSISFDLPSRATCERQRLRTWLQENRFGHLQGSLWITHRP